jgi:hypothetical protein
MQRIPAEQVPIGARVTTDYPRIPMGTVKHVDMMIDRAPNRDVNWVSIELDEGGWFHCVEGELIYVEEGK